LKAHVDFDLFQAVDGLEEIELGKESIGTTKKGEKQTTPFLFIHRVPRLTILEASGTFIHLSVI
jgi:hypothetical protein